MLSHLLPSQLVTPTHTRQLLSSPVLFMRVPTLLSS